MLPILVALWQTDATVHGAIEEQIQSSFMPVGSSALMTGVDLALDAEAIAATSTWRIRGDGRYAHALGFALAQGTAPPTSSGSFDLAGAGSWQVTPRAQLAFDAQGSIASRFGLRALEGVAGLGLGLDPFQSGDRLSYVFGGDAHLYVGAGQRSSLRASVGYTQEGGLAADSAAAVGLDAVTGRAAASWGWEAGARDTIVPELRIAATRFEHAILDVDLHRGRVDTAAVTTRVGDTHAFSRSLTLDVSAGATLARTAVLEPGAEATARATPEAHVGLAWVGRRARASASYTLGFASLGARVASGQQHALLADFALRPVSGARFRDLLVHATARFTHGAAEIAGAPLLGGAAPRGSAWATTTTVAAGSIVELPLRRGVALRGGFDLQLARGVIDPAPSGGSPGAQLQAVVLIGIAGTLSTDPERTVLRDPLEEEEARARAEPGAWQRVEDRARAYRPRAGDAADPESIDSDREPPGRGDDE